jgi:hypothetical protein
VSSFERFEHGARVRQRGGPVQGTIRRVSTVAAVRAEDRLGTEFAEFPDEDLARFLSDSAGKYAGRQAHPLYPRLLALLAAHTAEVRRRRAGKSPYMVPDAPVKSATVDKVSTTFAVGDVQQAQDPGKDGLGSTHFGVEARDIAARMAPAAFAPGGGRWAK